MAASTASITVNPALRWRRIMLGGVAGKIGVALLVIGAAVAILGPFFAPYSPTALVGLPLDPPSSTHWLGTDQLGRDVLSRVLTGDGRWSRWPRWPWW